MKAIVTKYFPATNYRSGRIKAVAEGGNSVTISHPDVSRDAHAEAAAELCKKMKWSGILTQGVLPNGDHVFVFTSEEPLKEELNTVYHIYGSLKLTITHIVGGHT